jgi:hypothetical protein
MKSTLTEDAIEQYQLQLLQNLGYTYHHGYDLQPTDSPRPLGEGLGEMAIALDKYTHFIHKLILLMGKQEFMGIGLGLNLRIY